VQLREPAFTDGYIQFSIQGSVESKGGAQAAAADENTVMFKQSQRASIVAVRDLVEEYITRRLNPIATVPPALDVPSQIRKLAQLRDEGLVSDEEYETKRLELLDRM
jgi:hypothetical protein